MKVTTLFLVSLCGVAFGQMAPQPMQEVSHDGEQCLLDWPGISGRTYFIQYSLDLKTWSFMPVIESGTGGPLGYGFDTDADKMFLRLYYTDIPTSNPSSDDFDGDGISNWDEVKEGGSGTNPLLEDTNGDGIRDDGLVYEAYNDPDGAGLPASLDAGLTGCWDFEQLNANTYVNTEDINYPAEIGGTVPIDDGGIISKASSYDSNGDWLKIDPRIFNQNASNSISLWFSFEEDWVQNKSIAIPAARRTAFWSYNTENTAGPKLILSAYKALTVNEQQKIILSTYNNGVLADLMIAYVPQGEFIDDSDWHQLTFVQSATTASIWLDGNKLVEQSLSSKFGGATSAGWFVVGKTLPTTATSINDTNFRGKIDRLRTYDRSLTAVEIDAIFHQDADGDGLYDKFEAKYRQDRAAYADSPDADDDRDELTNLQEQSLDTHPRNFDTDGDLLPDGFETVYFLDAKDPNTPNGKLDDPDGDGLLNIDELIHGSDPKNTDSDGDGTNDKAEADQGSYPADASDNGAAPDPAEIMQLRLSVGDPSGSHSERYSLRVSDMKDFQLIINHQARDFGVVSEKVYNQFRKGRSYLIQIRWIDTNKPDDELPDFDYFSEVAFVNAADGVDYLLFDAVSSKTKKMVFPANGQKVLESSRDQQGLPVGTGDSGSLDFLTTIEGYRGILLDTNVVVLGGIEDDPQDEGLVVEKADQVYYRITQHITPTSYLRDSITWYRRQLKWDGTYEAWAAVENATGTVYQAPAATAGIFEVKAVIGGQDYFFERRKDDSHSSKKEGENDCYGVVDEAWQFTLWEEAKSHLGSLLYAQERKNANFPRGEPKCNQFVYHRGNSAGTNVALINGSIIPRYPPLANQWAGASTKAIPKWLLLPRETYPQPGFMVSRTLGRGGHCGILGYDGAWISAGEKNVNRVADLRSPSYNDDDPNTPQGAARVRKYTP